MNITWKRSKDGIYASNDGRWFICRVGKGNRWSLWDNNPVPGGPKYYRSLVSAQKSAEKLSQDEPSSSFHITEH